ncbi:MAG: hypothetical protein ABH896_03585 [Candidatus Jacksonbacteria bacterium]
MLIQIYLRFWRWIDRIRNREISNCLIGSPPKRRISNFNVSNSTIG